MQKSKEEDRNLKAEKDDGWTAKKEPDSKKYYLLVDPDGEGKPVREIDVRVYKVSGWKMKNC